MGKTKDGNYGGMTLSELRKLCRELQVKGDEPVDQIIAKLKKHFLEKGIRDDFNDYLLVSAIYSDGGASSPNEEEKP